MGLKEKIKKLKKRKPDNAGKENTGILDGLVVLGALAGALSISSDVSAEPTCDANSHEISGTDAQSLPTSGHGIDTSGWDNHCWWDHAWHDHTWSDWADWLDWSLWSM